MITRPIIGADFLKQTGLVIDLRNKRLVDPTTEVHVKGAAPSELSVTEFVGFSANLSGAKIFSKVDVVRAYHHIPVAPEDIENTAVLTPFGLFEFVCMPFGLRNAAQLFQRFM